MIHALTFDVEEYFHVHAFSDVIDPTRWDEYPSRVVESTHTILGILADARVTATFFVLGWVAERHPQLVRDIAAGGHELASHGYGHQRVDALNAEQFRDDIRRSKQLVEKAGARPVTGYRAPSFSITAQAAWAHQTLVEEGYTLDSSMAAGRRGRSTEPGSDGRVFTLQTPAGPLTEFPLPAVRRAGVRVPVGGGGYFRLFPYWLTRRWLRSIEESGRPFCVYLHPWEFDSGQPRLTAPLRQNVRHRVNIAKTDRRLRQLVRDFRCGTLSDALNGHRA